MANNYRVVFLLLLTYAVRAASCCGGGASKSLIITGDHRYKFSSSYSNTGYIYDVDKQGIAKKRDGSNQEVKESVGLSYIYAFDNYIQLAIQSSYVIVSKSNQRIDESSSQFGDTQLSASYEFLKEKYFNYLIPRGFLFQKYSLPTGKSKYNFKERFGTDVSGSGQYSISNGLYFFKIIKKFDYSVELSREDFVSRDIENKRIIRDPVYNATLSLGYNPNFSPIRLGTSLSYKKEGEIIVKSNSEVSTSSKVKLWEAGLSLSYMMNENNSLSLSYSDQTIFSEVENTALSRSFSLNYSVLGLL